MKLLVSSDFHIGLSRKANFTPESSRAREQASRDLLKKITAEIPHGLAICVGDFFDKANNDETTIARASEMAQRWDYVLYGNHDRLNREDQYSSLDLVCDLSERTVGVKTPTTSRIHNTVLSFVPHCLTQKDFDDTLVRIVHDVEQHNGYKLLFLHCNYDAPFEGNEQTLNLTEAQAKWLLSAFHFIFIGHEHTAKTLFDGRLFIVGCHFPTAFDNIDDKRALVFDSAIGKVEEVTIWKASENSYKGPASEAPSGKQFYDLEVDPDHSVEAQRLAVRLFKEGALGVRLLRQDTKQEAVKVELRPVEHLPELIAEDLAKKDKALFELWRELCSA